MSSIFSFSASQNGLAIPLTMYTEHIVVVVNTASRCSMAFSNLQLLNQVQSFYNQKKFTVLAFPCAQFANQEPLSSCDLVVWRNEQHIQFPVFDKVNIKGKDADPLFQMLQRELGKARWNYTKYVCDRAGVPRFRLEPSCSPAELQEAIEKLL